METPMTTPEERIAELLRALPAPPQGWIEAAKELPTLRRELDTIVERSGVAIERLLPRLLDLELRGLIRRAGGGRFVRI